MKSEQTLATEESLQIIQNMISRAKTKYMNNNFYYLMWGWLLFAAGITEYIIAVVMEQPNSWLVWPAQGIIGRVVTAIYTARKSKKTQAATLVDRVITGLWMVYIATLILLIVFTVMVYKTTPTPSVLILTGLPTFLSGYILKFKPLMVGGVIFWIMGSVAYFIPVEWTSFMFSAAILLGYIIPGYMLQAKEEKDV